MTTFSPISSAFRKAMFGTHRNHKHVVRFAYNLLDPLLGEEIEFLNYGVSVPESSVSSWDEPCRELYMRLAERAGIEGSQHILDVGCGRGGGLAAIVQAYGMEEASGLDISARQISRARAAFPNISWSVGDAENLPYPDESFDVVVTVESSHCFPSCAAFMAEACRVLRGGGTLAWADLRDEPMDLECLREAFVVPGLELMSLEEWTDDVVRALIRTQDLKEEFVSSSPCLLRPFLRYLAACPNTRVFNEFVEGRRRYFAGVLRKSANGSSCLGA